MNHSDALRPEIEVVRQELLPGPSPRRGAGQLFHTLPVVDGTAMAGWMAPFLLQTLLILFGNSRLHRLPGQLMTSALGLR